MFVLQSGNQVNPDDVTVSQLKVLTLNSFSLAHKQTEDGLKSEVKFNENQLLNNSKKIDLRGWF